MIMVQPKLDTRLPAPLWPNKAVGSAESILALYQVTEGLGKSAALSVCEEGTATCKRDEATSTRRASHGMTRARAMPRLDTTYDMARWHNDTTRR